jgi:hypothetical protein
MSDLQQMVASIAVGGVLAFAGAANATTYNDVADFSTTSSTGVFSYGTGVTGTSFVPYTSYSAPCQGSVSGLGCWQTATPVDLVPLVGEDLTGATLDYSTLVLPTNVLLMHPGMDTDSIVRFTAPATGMYNVSGFFELLDTHPTGVNVIIAFDGMVLLDSPLTAPPAMDPSTPGGMVPFGATDVLLHAGDTIDYGVNNAGDFLDDSTGLALTITTVPEPATWTIMLTGLALAGFGLRRGAKAVGRSEA